MTEDIFFSFCCKVRDQLIDSSSWSMSSLLRHHQLFPKPQRNTKHEQWAQYWLMPWIRVVRCIFVVNVVPQTTTLLFMTCCIDIEDIHIPGQFQTLKRYEMPGLFQNSRTLTVQLNEVLLSFIKLSGSSFFSLSGLDDNYHSLYVPLI